MVYQNTSLLHPTALGEIVVYVDGMNGLMNCPEMVQWLYSPLSNEVRDEVTLLIDVM